jgi:glycosyltransferase involved in cell wall biosynthesis
VKLDNMVYKSPRLFTCAPSPIRLVHVGTMEQCYKAQDYLLKAIKLCEKNGVGIKAVLIGDGKLRASLESLCKDLELDKDVQFAGLVKWGTALFNLLDEADLFIMCSLTEGMPRALLETMARGLPAIGTDVGGIPELLSPDVLVPPADEHALARRIMDLAADPRKLESLSERNFEESLKYKYEILRERRLRYFKKFFNKAVGN